MTQYQEDYGQYSNSNQQGYYSGLNIEDQSETSLGSGPGYNNPPGLGLAGGQQASWGGNIDARPSSTLYSAPPVQPMYNDPQYQQGIV